MKTCTKCQTSKPYDQFYKNKRNKDGHHRLCKQCMDELNKTHYSLNKDRHLKWRNEYKQKVRQQCDEYKIQRGCVVCGENSHPHVLDLHHPISEEKEHTVADIATSFERWKKEADKCIVLCANCHRKTHVGLVTLP